MKKYLLIILMALPSLGFSFDLGEQLVNEVSIIENDSTLTSKMKKVIAQERIQKITKKYFKNKVNSREIAEAINEALMIPSTPISDILKNVLYKLLGPELAKFLIDNVLSLPEVEKRLTGLYNHSKLVFDPNSCDFGMKELIADVAFIAAVGAVVYFLPGYGVLVAIQAGKAAAYGSYFIVDITKINVHACDAIHRRYYDEQFL